MAALINSKSRLKKIDILYILLLISALALMIWKLPYGMGGWDEAFYLDVPFRLSQGDALFTDEWHVSQLSAFLLMPLVQLYTRLSGGTDGIIIAARWTYLAAHLAVTVFIYFRMRKYDFAGIAASILYFLFVPLSLMALSYNSMGLGFVVLTGLIMSGSSYEKPLPIIISGLLFAGAVLCNPFLLLAYLALLVCCIIRSILIKKGRSSALFTGEHFSFRTFLYFTLGAAILAIIFFAFLLSRVSLGDVFRNIPLILDDPEHVPLSIWSVIPAYFYNIIFSSYYFPPSFVFFLLILTALVFDRKRRLHRVFYFLCGCLALIMGLAACSVGILEHDLYMNIMFPFIYLGTICFILSDKKDYMLFVWLFCLGLIYSFAMFLSSNQYMVVISMAVAASNIASAAFIWEFMRELREEHRSRKAGLWPAYLALSVSLVFQLSLQGYVAARNVYWDYAPSELSARLEGGPADGVLTTPEKARRYQRYLADIEENLSGHPGENVLFLSQDCMLYLMADDMRCASFSGWSSGEDYPVLEKLIRYYEINPDKIPNHVYIPRETSYYAHVDEIVAENEVLGFTAVETDVATILSR